PKEDRTDTAKTGRPLTSLAGLSAKLGDYGDVDAGLPKEPHLVSGSYLLAGFDRRHPFRARQARRSPGGVSKKLGGQRDPGEGRSEQSKAPAECLNISNQDRRR